MSLFKSKQNKNNRDIKNKHKIIRDYENIRKETERLENESTAWGIAFNTIISLRTKASKLEKAGRLNEAINSYYKSVEFGEENSRINLNNYIHDIDRLIILYGKTKQKEKQKEFLKRVIATYPNCKDAEKWNVRLAKLKSENSVTITKLKQSDIKKQIGSTPTIGKRFRKFKYSLPNFNFYYDMPENMETFEYLRIKNPVPFEKSVQLRKYKETFETVINKAKIAENEKNLKLAIEIYEKLVAEEFEGKEPYERLMILYRKLNWRNEEIRLIKTAIIFFRNLQEQQKHYVLKLAEEYNMTDKAIEYIKENKKIFYYGGAFELYNPFPIINKWQERLIKLTKN